MKNFFALCLLFICIQFVVPPHLLHAIVPHHDSVDSIHVNHSPYDLIDEQHEHCLTFELWFIPALFLEVSKFIAFVLFVDILFIEHNVINDFVFYFFSAHRGPPSLDIFL